MIIGITGTIGAGKGTVVDYLVKQKGFKHYSVRDFLTDEIIKRGLPVNRDSMREVGNDLRRKGVLITIILYEKAVALGGNAIVESMRSLREVVELKKRPGFYLFAVDADIKLRYERVIKRASETDKVSFEKFVEQENSEMYDKDPSGMNIKGCMEQADYLLTNNGAPEELYRQVDAAMADISTTIP